MKRTALWLSTAALVCSTALGQEPAPQVVRLSLAEALERARAASPRLVELHAYEDAALASLKGAKGQRLPSLTFSAAYSRNSNVPEFVAGQPPEVIFPNLPDQGYARASFNMPLYTGGRIKGQIAAGGAQNDAARYDASAGDQDLVLETTRTYWTLVTGREAERVLREAIGAYAAHLADAGNRYDAGMAARNDVLAVQVEKDRAELARLEAENDAALAEARLIRLLDLPPGSTVEPTSTGAGESAETPESHGLEALVTQALAARPEIAALTARVAAAEAGEKTARSGRLPQANLSGSYDYANPNNRIFPLEGVWRDTWSVGVGVSFTPFDGGRTKAAMAQARAQAEAVRSELEDLRRGVRLEVTSRVLEMHTARARLAVTLRNLEAARENVRVSQDRYKEGVSLSSDLLDAETRLLQAGLDRTRSESEVRVAQASLDRAVGR